MSLPYSCFSLLSSGTVSMRHHTQLFQKAPNQRCRLGLQLSRWNVYLVWRKPLVCSPTPHKLCMSA